MTNLQIVNKLIGNINPTGETHCDEERFVNLRDMCDLVESLVGEIAMVAKKKDMVEFSIKQMGQYADKFLKNLINETQNT